ncbi:MAG: response regulator receiver protein [Atopobiaceae bacterium]|nr:response regulator receiver protein [Atopobiaceae bacterium]
MAFDPQREDYQRLGLRFASTLDTSSPAEATRAFATFGRRFARERDTLPQSDGDRAFHLVATAAKHIDYELPFADDAEAEKLIQRGHALLDEALQLDARCYDAMRMKAAADNPSFEAFFSYLTEHAEEVRRTCEEQRDHILANDDADERTLLAADIAMRPYLRWIATQAEQALICGRNREALRLARVDLEADPRDVADARFTAAFACAKLEDEQALDELLHGAAAKRRIRPANDAWALIARLALAHKHYDLPAASALLNELIRTYPHAAESFVRQIELPEGVFARLSVRPYSEDELVLAISEATVLLQEGRDPEGRGVLSAWVAAQAAQTLPRAVLQMLAEQAEANARATGRGADHGKQGGSR